MTEDNATAMISAYTALIRLHRMPYRTPDDAAGAEWSCLDASEPLIRLSIELGDVLDLLEDEQLRALSVAVPVWPGSETISDLDRRATALLREIGANA